MSTPTKGEKRDDKKEAKFGLDTPDLNKVFSNLSLNGSPAKKSSGTPSEERPTVSRSEADASKGDSLAEKTSTTKVEAAKDKTDAKGEFKVTVPVSPSPKKSLDGLSADLIKFMVKLETSNNVIVMCGAGLSVSAGIPDFRTPAEAVFEINYFRRNPEPFRQLAAELWPGRKYLPTKGHYFIKLLHDKGKLLRCYTQNIDSLEGMTGLPKEKVVAAHGNFDNATCVFTRKKVPVDEVRDAYLQNTLTDLNKKYGTKLVKPDIVFFGEALPERFHQLVPKDFPKCDLLIVMGTSLKVHPFASLIAMVPRGTPRMLVNRERVGEYSRGFQFHKGSTDIFLKGDCDDGVQQIADAIGWGEELLEIAAPRL